ncbi:gluzincin family metallopeptidase [Microvirga pudoricolor]|uniref:hypothetical protein n=1 Tax=Microvirga pudoricolor TaxID=2778729 RepID=UPI00194EB5D9|nr:hypothetical protein [Microvirga pudoricolor]MBM6594039.1 hypothetical protein [Microvirga pudoricolor]
MDAFATWSPDAGTATASVGTRFLVYPQPPFVPGYERPELVWLPVPPGQITAGPASRRAYVRDPALPKEPYQAPYLPPFQGPCFNPVAPGPDGHFDHLEPGSRDFMAAHAFACTHRVLDICENYLGRTWPWFFEPELARLEIIPHVPWDNAQAGWGFLELGEDERTETRFPFALNFDVIAHELAHLVLMSTLGLPRYSAPSSDFLAYHEAVADFVSLIGLLHFDTAMDRILRRTRGNLLVMNELDRFAELSEEKQVRRFSNSLRMGDVGHEVHDRSKPFAGALFDTLIEIYQAILFERGLSRLDPRSFAHLRLELSQGDLERELQMTGADYELRHFPMKAALAEARDTLGEALMRSWDLLDPDRMTFADAKDALVEAALRGRGARYADRIADNFAWRGFD